MSSNAVGRLAEAVGALAGREVELERPKDASLGDYATNVALQSAKARGPAAARARGGARRRSSSSCREVERAEVAGPGFVNLRVTDAFFVEALAEIGEDYGGGSAGDDRSGSRSRCVSANPTGPITVASARNGAYGDSVARLLEFGGHEVEREYYYNDAGGQMERFRALGRGGAPRRGAAGGRLPRRVHRGSRARRGRPGAADARAHRGDAGALPHPLRLVGEAEHARAGAPGAPRDAAEPTSRTARCTSARRSSATTRIACCSARTSSALPTYEAADVAYLQDKLERGFDRAIYVLGADHHGVRRRGTPASRGCSATTPRASRCSSTSSCT